jgi:predicted nucleic acid-binding protein
MIAALCTWHEHHEAASAELNQRLTDGETLIVAAPALVETYAVLTLLPSPHRLSGADALAVIDGSFMTSGRIVALAARSYRTLLRQALEDRIVGGQVYDAVIAQCGLVAKVSALLTFDAKHFTWLSDRGVQVVVPGQR